MSTSSSEQTRRYGSYFFIAALAVLFALQWGPGSQGCDTRIADAETVATVNGKPIGLKEFARVYSQQADNYRRQGLPAEFLKQFGIHKQVIDQLVNTELLSQEAESRGLSTSNDELVKVLRDIPAFQKDGKFDKDAYRAYVRQVEGTTDVFFEDKLKRQLAAQRLLDLVESSVSVSEEEVRAKYFKEGDTATLTVVRFAPAMFAGKVGAPKAAELDAWTRANDAAILTFYEQNKANYFVPEKVKAKQIVLKIPADADETKKAEVKLRIENVRKEIVDNKRDFSDLAKSVSEDTGTRDRGGDLGEVERLDLPQGFADLLFALQPGEITAPVETPMGWFIGTVTSKKPAEQRPFDTVKKEIATQLFLKDKAKALAKSEVDKAFAQLEKGKTLSELFPAAPSQNAGGNSFAAETKPEAKDVGPVLSSAAEIPQLGNESGIKKRIFDMKAPGLIKPALTVGDTFIIASVNERKIPTDADFETQKTQLSLEAIKAKRFEIREGFLKSLKQLGTVVTNDSAIDKVVSGS